MSLPGVHGMAGVAGPKALPDGGASVKHAAEEFEAYLIQMLLKEMRETIPDGGMGGGLGGGVFQSLADQALATAMAKSGGIGLTQALVDHAAKDGRFSP